MTLHPSEIDQLNSNLRHELWDSNNFGQLKIVIILGTWIGLSKRCCCRLRYLANASRSSSSSSSSSTSIRLIDLVISCSKSVVLLTLSFFLSLNSYSNLFMSLLTSADTSVQGATSTVLCAKCCFKRVIPPFVILLRNLHCTCFNYHQLQYQNVILHLQLTDYCVPTFLLHQCKTND